METHNDTFDNIRVMLKADYPLLYAVTTEYYRCCSYLRNIASDLGHTFMSWDCVNGLHTHHPKPDGKGWETRPLPDTGDYMAVLKHIEATLEANAPVKPELYFLEDLHRHFGEEEVFTRLRKLAERLRFYKKHIVLAGPYVRMPEELEKYVTVVNIPLPGRRDLKKLLERANGKQALHEDQEKALIDSALGMTDTEAELAFRLAKVRTGLDQPEAPQAVSREKEQLIKKSGILDYFDVQVDLEHSLGGLDNLKTWLKQRQRAFERKAKTFGLQEPKGILLVGVPGCGKSLTAKCVAASWRQPLLKLDIGKVFQAEVGSSENNLRQAIETAEAVAPCVLWIDEIEKGLGGNGGERDGGTSSRVFSTILTWMQEKTKPVFVVATANNIQALPPELLRKGRFDEIFYVDLPTQDERANIFRIHLTKHKQKIPTQLDSLVEKTRHFNGAEIEECVKEAMFIAYAENPDAPQLKLQHLVQAITPIVPLARTMPNQVAFLRDFGRSNRARPASSTLNQEGFESPDETGKTVRTLLEQDMDIYSNN